MELILSILTYRGLPPTRPTELVLNGQDASLGRNPDNDLSLPDPDRFVSGAHARIRFRDGRYQLADVSTNGTYVNHAPNPLGRGNTVELHDGDVLSLGEYELRVKLRSAAEPPPLMTPAPPPAAPPPPEEPDQDLDPLALMAARSSRPEPGIPEDFQLQPPAPTPAPPTSEPSGIPDLGIPADFDLLAPGPPADQGPSQPDHVPEDQQAYTPPPAFPEDFDLLGTGTPPAETGPATPAPPAAPPAVEPPPGPPTFEPPSAPPAFEPPPGPPPFEPTAPPPFEATPEEPPRRPAPPRPTTPAPTPAVSPPSADEAALVQQLLEGLGLNATVPPEAQAALAHTVGRLVRVATEGLMQVLSARTSFKRELRIEMTTIKPVENNPLKFSPDPDDALGHMLLGQKRGYLPAVQATQEALDDILAHELAIIAGLKAALHSLLARFDPAALEQRFGGDSVLNNLLPMARKAKCWDLFSEIHGEVARDAEEGFLRLFGDEFIRAYEEQVLKLKTARARRPQ